MLGTGLNKLALMKNIPLILLGCTIGVASSFAGEIYGTIKEGDKPVPKGIAVSIMPGGTDDRAQPTPKPSETDDYGNYRVIVPETGKCTITVKFKEQSVTAEVQSYSTPVRFDWVLVKTGTAYSLKRQ